MRSLNRVRLVTGLILLSTWIPAQPSSSTSTHPLVDSYRNALENHQESVEDRKSALVEQYTSFLQKQAPIAQSRGDLESLLAIRKEETAVRDSGRPSEEPATPDFANARSIFSQRLRALEDQSQSAVQDMHRTFVEVGAQTARSLAASGEAEAAQQLAAEVQRVNERLIALNPPPIPTPTPVPEKLGPSILYGGDAEEEGGWRIFGGGRRNKTEFYQERNSGMNRVFRLEQREEGRVEFRRAIRLKPGAKYRLTWRVRLKRPWRDGIELRGKGNYRLGFRIPYDIFRALTEAEQAASTYQTFTSRELPPDREWRQESAVLTAADLQEEFVILATPGEGEMLIDDVLVREILPQNAPKP